jgi:hypothetical protein
MSNNVTNVENMNIGNQIAAEHLIARMKALGLL